MITIRLQRQLSVQLWSCSLKLPDIYSFDLSILIINLGYIGLIYKYKPTACYIQIYVSEGFICGKHEMTDGYVACCD